MRTIKNIVQHELIGLPCEVLNAENKSNVGIKGRIIDETMKTVVLKVGVSKKRIQKKGSLLKLNLGEKSAIVDGNILISRPEDRIKRKIKKW